MPAPQGRAQVRAGREQRHQNGHFAKLLEPTAVTRGIDGKPAEAPGAERHAAEEIENCRRQRKPRHHVAARVNGDQQHADRDHPCR